MIKVYFKISLAGSVVITGLMLAGINVGCASSPSHSTEKISAGHEVQESSQKDTVLPISNASSNCREICSKGDLDFKTLVENSGIAGCVCADPTLLEAASTEKRGKQAPSYDYDLQTLENRKQRYLEDQKNQIWKNDQELNKKLNQQSDQSIHIPVLAQEVNRQNRRTNPCGVKPQKMNRI